MDDIHVQLKNEDAHCVAVIKTLAMVEKKIKDLKTKLIEVDRKKKSAEAALASAEKQVDD